MGWPHRVISQTHFTHTHTHAHTHTRTHTHTHTHAHTHAHTHTHTHTHARTHTHTHTNARMHAHTHTQESSTHHTETFGSDNDSSLKHHAITEQDNHCCNSDRLVDTNWFTLQRGEERRCGEGWCRTGSNCPVGKMCTCRCVCLQIKEKPFTTNMIAHGYCTATLLLLPPFQPWVYPTKCMELGTSQSKNKKQRCKHAGHGRTHVCGDLWQSLGVGQWEREHLSCIHPIRHHAEDAVCAERGKGVSPQAYQ